MRNDLEIKVYLSKATKSAVRRAFLKRQFKDNFTDEEMVKVKEIDDFLRAVNLQKNNPMFEDTRTKYTCIVFKSTYKRKNGTNIDCFIPKFINQEDFDYKIPYYVAKCIYRLSQKKCIEVFFTVNTLRAVPNENNRYIPERKRENVLSSSSLYVDLDLPSELIHLSNEEILNLLKTDFEELFINIEPSYIIRSGGGCHLYYTFEESFFIKTDEQIFFYMDMLRTIQGLFESYGADIKCVDMARILRVPNCKNRKEKYGEQGRDISIIYKSGKNYDVFELDKKLKFLLQGGMTGLCEDVLGDIFDDFETENSPDDICEQEDQELQEEQIEVLELKPKEKKVSATVKRLVDFGYKGIQQYYDYNGETYFQAKDIMCWIQNRNNHEGERNNILFFMNYIWFVYNRVWTYEAMLERSRKLNTYFNPNLSETELIKAVKYNFNNLNSRKHYNLSIRNTTIQSYLHFTKEEKQYCCIGLYCDTYKEYQEARRLRKMQYSRERYTCQLEQEGLIRRTERKEQYKKLLEENPLMTVKEFKEITGLGKSSFDVYKKEIGNSREKHFQQQKDYYLQPFKSNPDISCKEYTEILNCSKSSYRKYRKLFREEVNI